MKGKIPRRLGALVSLAMLTGGSEACSRSSEGRSAVQPKPNAAAARTFGPNEQASLAEAKAFYGRGDYSSAFEAAKKALTPGRESLEAYALISRIYMDASQDPQAVNFFKLVAEDLGGSPAWYYTGFHQFRLNRWDEALAAFRKAAELDPLDAESRFREGLVLQARGDFPGAISAMLAARQIDPESLLAAARLARLYRITGDYGSSERLVREMLSRAPDNGELLYALAQLRLREGKNDEAEPLLRRSIEGSPDLREAHYDLARVLAQRGDEAGAERERRLYRRLSDYAEGLQSIAGKFAARPEDSSLILTVAEMHLTERRWGEAVRALARAAAAKADPARVACARAEAHYGSGAPSLGDEDVREAEREPANTLLASRLALAKAAGAIARRDRQGALSLLSEASGPAAPKDRLFLLRVADAYGSLGRDSEAESVHRRAEAQARPE